MERRTSFRVPCGISVDILLERERVRADLMNISQKGMFLRSNLLSPMESLKMASAMTPTVEVVMTFSLVGQAIELRAAGRVAWKSDMGVGVDFHQVSPELRSFIEQLSHNLEDVQPLLQQIAGTPEVNVMTH
jgi:c-di-GMP-binding flagellar brake protein YcgR